MSMNQRFNVAATVLLAFAVSGCGGGKSATVPQTPISGAVGPAKMARATVTIRIGGNGASAARKPKYISPATNGVAVTVYSAYTQSGSIATPPPNATAAFDI